MQYNKIILSVFIIILSSMQSTRCSQSSNRILSASKALVCAAVATGIGYMLYREVADIKEPMDVYHLCLDYAFIIATLGAGSEAIRHGRQSLGYHDKKVQNIIKKRNYLQALCYGYSSAICALVSTLILWKMIKNGNKRSGSNICISVIMAGATLIVGQKAVRAVSENSQKEVLATS